MSLHCLAFFLATSLKRCLIYTPCIITNPLPPVNTSRYGKFGIGACPKVTPMKGFDVTKIYDEKWYLIAHYSQGHLYERHAWSTHGIRTRAKISAVFRSRDLVLCMTMEKWGSTSISCYYPMKPTLPHLSTLFASTIWKLQLVWAIIVMPLLFHSNRYCIN